MTKLSSSNSTVSLVRSGSAPADHDDYIAHKLSYVPEVGDQTSLRAVCWVVEDLSRRKWSWSNRNLGSYNGESRKSSITESHLKNNHDKVLYGICTKDWCWCRVKENQLIAPCNWETWNTPLVSSESVAVSLSVCRSSLYFTSTSWKQIITKKQFTVVHTLGKSKVKQTSPY